MPVTPDYIAHLAAANGLETACGEPWQGWQEPFDADLGVSPGRYRVDPPMSKPRPHIDRIRQCQACLRVALRNEEGATPG